MDIPKISMPKVEIPKIKMPKIEMPKVEMPKVEMPKISTEVLKSLSKSTPFHQNKASEFCKKLYEMIRQFDDRLDQEHEVGVRLVSFGQTVNFHVTRLGYYDPSLIRFQGSLEDGSPVELIQHVSQISFLLMAMKRSDPTQPKKPIGFNTEE